MLNKQEMVKGLNKTRLKLTCKAKTFSHWLKANNVRCQHKEIAFEHRGLVLLNRLFQVKFSAWDI